MEVDSERANPGKGALKLMDRLFSSEELANCCYKNISGRCAKPELDKKQVKYLESKCSIITNIYSTAMLQIKGEIMM